MNVRAAVPVDAGKPLEITNVKLDGPREGEVMIEIKATGVCHTDEFTLSGADPEGLFPAILGHEGAGVVVDTGRGVTGVKKGDHVIPLYTPECRQCPSCLSRKTNLCTAIRATQGQGVMPDGTSRFSLAARNYFTTWERRLSRILLSYPRSRSRRSARTRRSTRSATSAAGSRPGSAPSSTPPKSSRAPTSSCSGWGASGSTSYRAAA